MFKPKTDRIRKLAEEHPDRIKELERIFDKELYLLEKGDFAGINAKETPGGAS